MACLKTVDSVFAGKSVSVSVSKKCADGRTRSFKLPEGVLPKDDTLEAFAAKASEASVQAKRSGKDNGVTITRSVKDINGDAVKNAILALGDNYRPGPTAEETTAEAARAAAEADKAAEAARQAAEAERATGNDGATDPATGRPGRGRGPNRVAASANGTHA